MACIVLSANAAYRYSLDHLSKAKGKGKGESQIEALRSLTPDGSFEGHVDVAFPRYPSHMLSFSAGSGKAQLLDTR